MWLPNLSPVTPLPPLPPKITGCHSPDVSYRRVVKWFKAIIAPVLFACWLVASGLPQFTLAAAQNFPDDSSPAQTTAPADNDDLPDDAATTSDCALLVRGAESIVPLQSACCPQSPAVVFPPPATCKLTSLAPPQVWQFAQRTAASPRAPTRLA